MSITIHYKGSIKNLSLIDNLQKEMVDICQSMNWEYQLWNEDLSKPCDATLIHTDGVANIEGHIPLRGITIVIDKNKTDLVERIENFRKLVEDIIKEKTLDERIEKVVVDKMRLTQQINEFERGIKDIIYKFEVNNIPLKGTCGSC